MYCPRCGHQPISEALRFCSYCGLKLGVVKASLADEDEVAPMAPAANQALASPLLPRDINIGVILMFVGTLVAALLAGRDFGREGGALILLVAFSSILLLSRPLLKLVYRLLSWEKPPAHAISVNQRRMMFGSMLMFASTIILAISSLMVFGRMRTPEFLFGLLAVFVVLLFVSKYLTRALRYLVADDVSITSPQNVPAVPVSVGDAAANAALTAGREMPVSLFGPQRVQTAEILTPASVTENTTNLLDDK